MKQSGFRGQKFASKPKHIGYRIICQVLRILSGQDRANGQPLATCGSVSVCSLQLTRWHLDDHCADGPSL